MKTKRKKIEHTYDTFKNNLKSLQASKINLQKALDKYKEKLEQFVQALMNEEMLFDANTGGLPFNGDDDKSPTPGNTFDNISSGSQLLSATKQMQEIQMSFNPQYLQLQSQMRNENRSYTAVSNIMKTKHDTIKNSISNVR
jgi:hypothetical protein